jgi:hypothetical protein
MSQRYMSKIIYETPNSLRTRLQRNLPAAAAAWNAEKDLILGVQGSKHDRSRPGEPPRQQTGKLRKQTVAVPAASTLSIQIITTAVGKWLNGGTPRIKRRPFINLITRRAAAAMKAALHKP